MGTTRVLDEHLSVVLDMYIGSFAARLDAYVRDSRRHVNEPLTPGVAYAALGVGGFSVSGYMAAWEGQHTITHLGAIDFDTEDGLRKGEEAQAWLLSQGVGSLLEESRRGSHLWVFSESNLPASIMRQALRGAAVVIGCDMTHTEVFPKKSGSDWGVGALRMPLMRHPKTGVRYPVHGPEGTVTSIEPLVLAVESATSPVEALRRLALVDVGDTPTWPRSVAYRLRTAASGPSPRVSEVLATYGVFVTPGRGARCPFHDDRHASLQVAKDDERVWCKAPACPLYNDGVGYGSRHLSEALTKGAITCTPSGR
jgi:hypothetical protein